MIDKTAQKIIYTVPETGIHINLSSQEGHVSSLPITQDRPNNPIIKSNFFFISNECRLNKVAAFLSFTQDSSYNF